MEEGMEGGWMRIDVWRDEGGREGLAEGCTGMSVMRMGFHTHVQCAALMVIQHWLLNFALLGGAALALKAIYSNLYLFI